MAKFSITLKDPDYGVNDREKMNSRRLESLLVDKFLEWNEYVTIEFDTVTKTARVVPVAEMKS